MAEYNLKKVSISLTPKVGLAVVVLLAQLFLFVSADWVYGSLSSAIKPILIVYLLLQALVIGFYGRELPAKSEGIRKGLFNFTVGFMLTGAIIMVLPRLFGAVPGGNIEMLRVALGSVAVLQVVVITYTEESIWRAVLPKLMSDLWSNITFAIFHLSMVIYMLSLGKVSGSPLRFLIGYFMLGMAWSLVRTRLNVSGSWGSHTAFNFSKLGLLGKVFGI